MLLSRTASSGPSGRLEAKYSVSPSLESVDCASLNDVLIVRPRLTGSDHAEKLAVRSAENEPVIFRSASVPHARTRASGASETRVRDVVVMDPPSLFMAR